MANLELIKTSLENSLQLIEQKMAKSSHLISRANIWPIYIDHIKKGENSFSESFKKKELERYRKSLTFETIKALKIADLIIKEINICINILTNNKKSYWFSTLFNEVVEKKRKLNEQIFDAKSLKDKFGDKTIDFNSINIEEDEYVITAYDIINIGNKIKDFNFAYYDGMKERYGNTDKSNKDIIHNGYTQRISSFELNKKLRKGESLDKNETKIYSAIINSCNNNKLKENIYLFRYVSQEFINKYNIKFDRLSQLSVANAIFKFKKNIIDKKIKEKENGFISTSCNLKNNVFKSRDVLLVLYAEKGCHLYATNNEKETEIILPSGMIYHFFDCFFIEVKLFGEKCYQMVIKAFVRNYY